MHKGYNKRNKVNDIALLKLDPPINFDIQTRIRCVCEPQEQEDILTPDCVALGWGKISDDEDWSKQLRQVTLPL